MTRLQKSMWVSACAVLASAAFAGELAAADGSDATGGAMCGPLRDVDTAQGRIDYRLKDSSPVVRKGVHDLDHYHTNLAVEEFRSGSLYRSVKDNLDFALRHSPNHHIALQTLIRYDRAGGKSWNFPATECYIYWAEAFAPDDADVWVLAGYYFWTKNDLAKAEKSYLQALGLRPDSAEAHYDLGLLYVQLADYTRALDQAHAAYAAGYPLPGLRRQLERAGRWQDPAAASASQTHDEAAH